MVVAPPTVVGSADRQHRVELLPGLAHEVGAGLEVLADDRHLAVVRRGAQRGLGVEEVLLQALGQRVELEGLAVEDLLEARWAARPRCWSPENTVGEVSPPPSVVVTVRSSPAARTPLTKTGNSAQMTTSPSSHGLCRWSTPTSKPPVKKSAMVRGVLARRAGDVDAEARVELPGSAAVPRSTLTGPMLAPMWAASASTLTPKSISEPTRRRGCCRSGSSMAAVVSGRSRRSLTVPLAVEAELATGAGSDQLLVAELEADRLGDAVLALPGQVEAQLGAAVLSTRPKSMVEPLPSEDCAIAEGVLQRGRRRSR